MLKLHMTLDGSRSPAELVAPLRALQEQEDVQVTLTLRGQDPQSAEALTALVETLRRRDTPRRFGPALLGALAVTAYLSVALFGLF